MLKINLARITFGKNIQIINWTKPKLTLNSLLRFNNTKIQFGENMQIISWLKPNETLKKIAQNTLHENYVWRKYTDYQLAKTERNVEKVC